MRAHFTRTLIIQYNKACVYTASTSFPRQLSKGFDRDCGTEIQPAFYAAAWRILGEHLLACDKRTQYIILMLQRVDSMFLLPIACFRYVCGHEG